MEKSGPCVIIFYGSEFSFHSIVVLKFWHALHSPGSLLPRFCRYKWDPKIGISSKFPKTLLLVMVFKANSELLLEQRAIDVMLFLLVYSNSYFKVPVCSFLQLFHTWICIYWLFILDYVFCCCFYMYYFLSNAGHCV